MITVRVFVWLQIAQLDADLTSGHMLYTVHAEDENVQKILQRAHLLLGVRSSAKNKIKITPTDLREFLTELQPFKDRLQISPKVLAKAMLM